jgi:AcrR family transcriptional regulator
VRQGGPVTTETAESPWRTTRERGPQRDAKRDAVVRAAAKLFTTRGFKGTSLDDIAASLGVTKPTLYHYVANKEEILFACVQRGLDALRAGIEEATREGLEGREKLRAVLERYAAIVTSDFGLCVIRVGEEPLAEPRRRELRASKARIDTEFRVLIAEAMASGSVAPGDAAMAAYAVVGALGGIGRWYRPGTPGAPSLSDSVGPLHRDADARRARAAARRAGGRGRVALGRRRPSRRRAAKPISTSASCAASSSDRATSRRCSPPRRSRAPTARRWSATRFVSPGASSTTRRARAPPAWPGAASGRATASPSTWATRPSS